MTAHDEADQEPLSPAAERLRRKLVRLLLVSGGIMALGLIAVFAAIVYKLGEADGEGAGPSRLSAASPVEGRIAVPAGHRIASVALDADRALLTLEGPGGSSVLVVVDLASGSVLGRYRIVEE